MKIECYDHGAEINNLRSIIVGEIVSHIESSVGMMMIVISTTVTKDKVEFKLAEKVGEDWRR